MAEQRNGNPNRDESGFFRSRGSNVIEEEQFRQQLEADRGGGIWANLDHRLAKIEAQTRKQELYTSISTADASSPTLNLFANGLHLPEGAFIASVYVENHAVTASLQIIEGSGGNGRQIFIVKPASYGLCAMADSISSVSIVMDRTGDQGLIAVTITSRRWAPKHGSL